jgi:protease PrsW
MHKRLIPVLVLVALVPVAEFLRLTTQTPPLVLLAALLPAAALTALVLLVGRRQLDPLQVLLATFVWGAAVAAFLSSSANDLLHAWIASLAGEQDARFLTPTFAAPVVEELSKLVALLLVGVAGRDALRDPIRGIAYGALVGVGFAMTENLQYFLLAAVQGGTSGLGQAVYTRALLGGINHAVFTATTGAGIGWGRSAASEMVRAAAPLAGLAAAVAQHVAWNAIASREITHLLCNPAVTDGPCRGSPDALSLLVRAPLIVVAFVGPGLLALGAVMRARRV